MFDKIILNIPHSSTKFPIMSWGKWTNHDKLYDDIKIWTDHFTDNIFESKSNLNISSIIYPFSRFCCDVERLPNDPLENIGQGIIYNKSNNNLCERLLSDSEKDSIMKSYNDHHNNLSKEVVDNSLIIDCHSFPSNLSDVDICIGFNEDETKPSDEIIDKINKFFTIRGFKVGINNPYSNSICTKTNYNYKSIMVEVNKKLYMDEDIVTKHSDFYKINHLMNSLYKILLNE